ncbi:hypothetical protein ACHAQH_002093 [Verticillium albo-atrum]
MLSGEYLRRKLKRTDLRPWKAELTTLAVIWQRLLNFSIVTEKLTLEEVSRFEILLDSCQNLNMPCPEAPEFVLVFIKHLDETFFEGPSLLVSLSGSELPQDSDFATQLRGNCHVITTWEWDVIDQVASFWMRNDVIEDMMYCLEEWDVWVYRSDDWSTPVDGPFDLASNPVAMCQSWLQGKLEQPGSDSDHDFLRRWKDESDDNLGYQQAWAPADDDKVDISKPIETSHTDNKVDNADCAGSSEDTLFVEEEREKKICEQTPARKSESSGKAAPVIPEEHRATDPGAGYTGRQEVQLAIQALISSAADLTESGARVCDSPEKKSTDAGANQAPEAEHALEEEDLINKAESFSNVVAVSEDKCEVSSTSEGIAEDKTIAASEVLQKNELMRKDGDLSTGEDTAMGQASEAHLDVKDGRTTVYETGKTLS